MNLVRLRDYYSDQDFLVNPEFVIGMMPEDEKHCYVVLAIDWIGGGGRTKNEIVVSGSMDEVAEILRNADVQITVREPTFAEQYPELVNSRSVLMDGSIVSHDENGKLIVHGKQEES